MAWAPLGPRPWCLMFISSLVMCSTTKETGMMPSWEQASRYALRPENWRKIGDIPCLQCVMEASENRSEAWKLIEELPRASQAQLL